MALAPDTGDDLGYQTPNEINIVIDRTFKSPKETQIDSLTLPKINNSEIADEKEDCTEENSELNRN